MYIVRLVWIRDLGLGLDFAVTFRFWVVFWGYD